MLRLFRTTLVVWVGVASLAAQAPVQTDATDARQIEWQRTLDDALALARESGRPLLLALNMDGESASDRIVRENYRDPAFVAATRACVCLVASVFRHAPRDHDDAGRRIPCPRLGSVTCGEHIALEQLVYERFLADGKRVAPRHAVVLPDGTKAWDISLSFDLHDIDTQVLTTARDEAARQAESGQGALPTPHAGLGLDALAARRDARGRTVLEDVVARIPDETTLAKALDAVAMRGDAGSVDALRIVGARLEDISPRLSERTLAVALGLGVATPLAEALRARLQAPAAMPTTVAPGDAAALLPALVKLDGAAVGTRSFVLASRALADYGEFARLALPDLIGADASAQVEGALAGSGGACSLSDLVQLAVMVRASSGAELPRPGIVTDALPDVSTLTDRLGELDVQMKTRRDDPELLGAYAKASLDLGRRYIETGEADARISLQDAELHFKRALEVAPDRTELWIERARNAYFLAEFAAEAEFGRRAFACATGRATGLPSVRADDDATRAILDDPLAIESLRWIGDGDARLLAERAGQDPTAELVGILEGVRALGLVAASPFGDEKDWISVASFCGALGLWREELGLLQVGAERLPTSRDLRQALNTALWNTGHLDLAPAIADWLASRNSPTADAAWFSGYAGILAAEDARRGEDQATAVRRYEMAAARFTEAARRNPQYVDSCDYFIALTWLGRGFAHARAERRTTAADCLVRAVQTHRALAEVRDGLGLDVYDLVDKVLEWRDANPSPVVATEWLDRLEAAAPGDSLWAIAIADSELREALRADGRNPVRTERDTVDASGNPIRMLMGVPNDEGDQHLRASLAAARRAARPDGDAEHNTPLAQSATIWAERMLERDRLDGVPEALTEAATALGFEPPADGAKPEALRALAKRLRDALGEARPRLRPGR